MELVFAWINNYRNIKDLQLNFGSDYSYSIDINRKDKKCIVTRKKNEKYIPNFFDPYLNLSAIVGENAAGKSSVLEVIRNVFNTRHYIIEYFFLFKDKDGNLYHKNRLNTKYHNDVINGTLENNIAPPPPPLDVTVWLDGFDKIQLLEENVSTILFSQFIDFNIYPLLFDKPIGIDISSNWLMHQDIMSEEEDTQVYIEKHKYSESKRQIDFYLNNKSNIAEYLDNIPDRMKVYFRYPTLNFEHDTPPSFMRYEKILIEICSSEQKKIFREIELSNDVNSKFQYRKRDAFLNFLRVLINRVFKTFESTPNYIHRKIQNRTNEQTLKTLSAEEAVYVFFKNQNFLKSEPIIDFIKIIKKEIERSVEIDVDSFIVEVNEFSKDIIDKYEVFLSVLRDKYATVYGFMSFDWKNMSTGEKAMLNLYSRFYYAKKLLLEQNQKPSTVLILIDEGEVGFHLQWQKEYVKNLVRNLPKIMHDDELDIKYQLIFTTHSPLSLSDLPNDRITYLLKGKIQDLELNTFGANISDIMKNSFFLQNGIIGSYAVEKIQEVIDWLNGDSCNDIKKYELIIDAIDEPIIKRKLHDMFYKKLLDNDCISEKEIERKKIQEQIDAFKNKYNEKI